MLSFRRSILGLVYKSSARSLSSGAFQSAFTWGACDAGQLGHPSKTFAEAKVHLAPLRIERRSGFKDIACGNTFTVALSEEGQLLVWGKDLFSNKTIWTPKPYVPEKRFVSVSAGEKHCAAICEEGLVYTWGEEGGWFSSSGYLGHGGSSSVEFPKLVQAFRSYGAKAKAVSCSSKNTFILTTDGEVLGCGSGEYGRLGTGVSADSAVPTPVAALADHTIVQIASAYSHTLALTDKGEIFVWGRNDSGQLGLDGSFIDIYSMEEVPRSISPKAFQGETGELSGKVVRISAAKGRSAAVTEDGRVFLWGHRVYHVPKLVEAPVLASGAPWKAIDVACGGDISKSCTAITTDEGHLWTFGGSDTLLGVSKNEPEKATALRKSIVSSAEAKSVPRLVTENILPDYRVTKVSLGLTHGAALVVGRG